MFPIRDHNPSGRVPYVNYALILINIAVFILTYMSVGQAAADPFGNMALVPDELADGKDLHAILTSMFQHAGFMHLAGNMLFLWIFGDNVEDALGHIGYLLFYIACGIGALLAHVLPNPESMVPVVGASGAIAGVMGAYLLLYPRAQVDVFLMFIVIFRTITIPAWIVLAIWFGMQVFSGVASVGQTGGGVAYWAHAGGFVAGVLLTLPYWMKRGGTDYWNRNHGHPPHPEGPLPRRIAEHQSR